MTGPLAGKAARPGPVSRIRYMTRVGPSTANSNNGRPHASRDNTHSTAMTIRSSEIGVFQTGTYNKTMNNITVANNTAKEYKSRSARSARSDGAAVRTPTPAASPHATEFSVKNV